MSLNSVLLAYEASHRHPFNQTCHRIGIPLILLSLGFLVAVQWLWFGLLFVVGWGFQFLGHKVEGTKPKFFENVLFLFVGPLYFFLNLFGYRPKP